MDDKNFPRTKTIEIFLIFLGIGTLFLGFWRLNNTVKGVLEKQPNYYQHNSADDYKTKEDMDKLIKLQTTDTDKDGISDYDELNVYHTSIYLADTDSDGINDKEEIDSGDNPNCPRGKDCSLSSEANNSSNNLSDPSSVFKNSPTGEEIYLKNSDNDLKDYVGRGHFGRGKTNALGFGNKPRRLIKNS